MILVTGGMGYVGQFLLREMAQQKLTVRCLIRPGKPKQKLLQLEQWGMEGPRVPFTMDSPGTAAAAELQFQLSAATVAPAP